MSMKFSIIVPAYNEEKLLPKCLESLVNLDYDKNEFEIILVNNNSQDRTREIALSFSGVKAIDEPKQGNVFALIRGCREARGEILVFTDADTQAPKDWLKKFEKAYQDKKVVCAGGPGIFRPVVFAGAVAERAIRWGGVITKLAPCFNLSIRKKVYEDIGGFDEKINFEQDIYLITKSKKVGKIKYLLDNPIITSSRRYKNVHKSLVYASKGLINLVSLLLLKKTLFFDFDNIRS